MSTTSANNWLLVHRILFALSFLALLSLPVAISNLDFGNSGPQWPWVVLSIDALLIGGLYLLQYVHQVYWAVVYQAKFSMVLFASNSILLILYLMGFFGVSFDFIEVWHLWGLFFFHSFALVGYFVYHNKIKHKETPQGDVAILDHWS